MTASRKHKQLPTLAIVGRPNVGKSTLFNRLVGSRRSIVGDEPGMTRDRIYGEADWAGRSLRVVDTGGIVPDDHDLIPSEIYAQARVGIEEADAIVMVVDGRSNIASSDLELARILLRSGKPLLLAVNKTESTRVQSEAEDEVRRLGIRDIHFISAEHGTNVAELLEAALARIPVRPPAPDEDEEAASALPEVTDEGEAATEDAEAGADAKRPLRTMPDEIRVAIIGRPNVGKSTLLNRLTGTERAIVSPIAGTTRDAVDELVTRNGRRFRFIDTAGIRRKGKTHLMAERLSVMMARKHLEAADIALLLIDATEGVAALDATIGGYSHESGRSTIVIINKWDLVGQARTDGKPPADRERFEEQVRQALKFLSYAPIIFISATTGKNADKIFGAIERVAAERFKRIATGPMNRFLEKVDFERASVPMNKRVRIYYLTQTSVAPPTFVLFTDRDIELHFSYQRFIENQIRQEFGFHGTPIWIRTRGRNKR